MNALLWLLPGLPLGVGGLLLLAGRRADRVAWPVALLAGLVTAVLAVTVAVGRPSVSAAWLAGLPAGLAVDGLSAVLVVTVTVVALAVIVYAGADLAADDARARFFGLLLVFVAGMLSTVTATNLGVLLAGWELMGAMSYALIGFWWPDSRRVDAANTAFLVTRAADLGLYLACAGAFAAAGTLEIDRLASLPDGWRAVVMAGLLVSALGKSAQIPFAFWLSRAMEGPSPVSALLHSATMVAAGAYLFLRTGDLLAAEPWAATTAAWVGVLTALLLGLVAVAQTDFKQLLAASTCAQMGFLVLSAAAGSREAGMAHLVAHAATKSLLFLAAGTLLHLLGTKDLRELAGAGRRLPLVGAVAAVGALSLAGAPPLSLWITKDGVLAGVLRSSTPLYLAGLAAGAVSALYAGKALVLLLRQTEEAPTERPRVPVAMAIPMIVLAVAAAVLGLVWLPTEATVAELVLSGALALVVLGAVTWWIHSGRTVPDGVLRRWFANWLGLEWLARRLVAVPVYALARGLATVDGATERAALRGTGVVGRAAAEVRERRVSVDGLVDAVMRWTARSAKLGRGVDDRLVDRAVNAVAVGTGWLGRIARRPQTGMSHQYYAQAVVGFAALAVLLLIVLR
ncbi:NADH-quinone oxidoreductase subunit 5 family protein [Amycolatopsis sp. H20-H5]|uniref:NADH-quinone oxidoreductase subunit 5 family protein n=1 Tax=Amycolatopsis sp. H20-H5 TaxID=3046309 RepID=UPI002DBFADB7|nr:proton-conducting transporter membrane subunit [Amycolatopsis sp. H20-H5]MEC3974411.1 proton-conducting transporter membrane subunit [Amycolatopsis sp. H20-H5]